MGAGTGVHATWASDRAPLERGGGSDFGRGVYAVRMSFFRGKKKSQVLRKMAKCFRKWPNLVLWRHYAVAAEVRSRA